MSISVKTITLRLQDATELHVVYSTANIEKLWASGMGTVKRSHFGISVRNSAIVKKGTAKDALLYSDKVRHKINTIL